MSNNKKVFFLHLRPILKGWDQLSARVGCLTPAKGGRTVAYTYDDNGVEFAIAKVNPNDVYDKSIGRKVSSERLLKAEDHPEVGYWPGSVDQFRRAITAGLSTSDRLDP